MRAWGRGALPINKMADGLSEFGYTQICVARGNVSWGSKDDDGAGELQLHERGNRYYVYVNKAAGGGWLVCKVIGVFTLHFQ